MGTVHYARMEKGDGTCPVCHMKLTQKTGESTGGAHHEHGEGEHHHGEGEHHMEHGE
jgi:hypothetical protein